MLALSGSAVAGFLGGCFYGFCATAHAAAKNGYKAAANRPMLRLLTDEHGSLSIRQAAFLLAFVALSLAVFFGGMIAPFALVSRLVPQSDILVLLSYVTLMGVGTFGWEVGKQIWRRVA